MPDAAPSPTDVSPAPDRWLSWELPGTGGVIRERPEDFLVEELPLYEPCGEGEHLYLFIEKCRLTTHDAVNRVARAFRLRPQDIGHAGLKDKHAVTRQHLSVHLPGASNATIAEGLERLAPGPAPQTPQEITPDVSPEAPSEGAHPQLPPPRLSVLWAERHTNKLRRGHHGGNRFVIRIRQVGPAAVVRAKPIFDLLVRRGLPNFYGQQRFGFRDNSHQLGRLLLLGDHTAFLDELLGQDGPEEGERMREARACFRTGDYAGALERWPRALRADRQALDALRQGKSAQAAVRTIQKDQRQLYVSALQSAAFNAVLHQRLAAGSFDRLLPGDLAWKHDSRAVFAVDQATADTENAPGGRVERFEVSPSGPEWGSGMTRASGDPGQLETAALTDLGLNEEQLAGPPGAGLAAEGARRPLRIPVTAGEIAGGADEFGPYLRLAFNLPRGAYATTLLSEVMKVPVLL